MVPSNPPTCPSLSRIHFPEWLLYAFSLTSTVDRPPCFCSANDRAACFREKTESEENLSVSPTISYPLPASLACPSSAGNVCAPLHCALRLISQSPRDTDLATLAFSPEFFILYWVTVISHRTIHIYIVFIILCILYTLVEKNLDPALPPGKISLPSSNLQILK